MCLLMYWRLGLCGDLLGFSGLCGVGIVQFLWFSVLGCG